MVWNRLGVLHVRKVINRDMLHANPIGADLDNLLPMGNRDELLTLHDIIDQIGLHDGVCITVKFDKNFLRRIIKSHIHAIQ